MPFNNDQHEALKTRLAQLDVELAQIAHDFFVGGIKAVGRRSEVELERAKVLLALREMKVLRNAAKSIAVKARAATLLAALIDLITAIGHPELVQLAREQSMARLVELGLAEDYAL